MAGNAAIELVLDFVNSPEFDSPPQAMALRDVMRGVIGAQGRRVAFPIDVATLNAAVVTGRLRFRFGADGTARLEPEADGIEGDMGRLMAIFIAASADPDWKRLKVCARPSCRNVFFDRSRNRSSRWCSMATCGNREKARRFRSKPRPGP